MVQGNTKNLKPRSPKNNASAKKAADLKKGRRAIAPKKAALVKSAKLKQVRDLCGGVILEVVD